MKNRLTLIFFILISIFQLATGQEADSLAQQKAPRYPSIKAIGLFQQHLIVNTIEDSPVNFRIRRARLGIRGKLHEKVKYNIIMGALEAPDNGPALVNAFVDFDIHPSFKVRTGQFFVPFGLEGPMPIPLNPAIERSVPVRQLNPHRMFRDIGVMFSGEFEIIKYDFAIINGNGANVFENLNPKDFVLRVSLTAVEDLNIGLSAQMGRYGKEASEWLSRQRIGLHAAYNPEEQLRLQGEFILLNNEAPSGNHDLFFGSYMLAGFKFTEKWEGIGRLEYLNAPNGGNNYYGLTVGANAYLFPFTRLSLNWETFTATGSLDDLDVSFTIQAQFNL